MRGASLRAHLLVGEDLGVPKPSGVCPEPAGKADHPPERATTRKKEPHTFHQKKGIILYLIVF